MFRLPRFIPCTSRTASGKNLISKLLNPSGAAFGTSVPSCTGLFQLLLSPLRALADTSLSVSNGTSYLKRRNGALHNVNSVVFVSRIYLRGGLDIDSYSEPSNEDSDNGRHSHYSDQITMLKFHIRRISTLWAADALFHSGGANSGLRG